MSDPEPPRTNQGAFVNSSHVSSVRLKRTESFTWRSLFDVFSCFPVLWNAWQTHIMSNLFSPVNCHWIYPTQHLALEAFWARWTGRRPLGRYRTPWRDYISHLVQDWCWKTLLRRDIRTTLWNLLPPWHHPWINGRKWMDWWLNLWIKRRQWGGGSEQKSFTNRTLFYSVDTAIKHRVDLNLLCHTKKKHSYFPIVYCKLIFHHQRKSQRLRESLNTTFIIHIADQ